MYHPTRPALFVALFLPLLSVAASPFEAVELTDPELDQLRGRYVLPNHIVHFGVTLTSSWEQSGQRLGASASLQVQQGVQPVLTVRTLSAGGGAAPAPGNGVVLGGQGLADVNGISQSVRTAGDLNSAANGVRVTIQRNGTAPALAAEGAPLSGGHSSHSNALGTATVSASAGALQVGIDTHGQGSSMQRLGGGLLQDTRIISSQNRVINTASLDVVMQPNGLTLDAANCTLDQLRALRPTGY